MEFALLIRSTRGSELGILSKPQPGGEHSAMLDFAKLLAREHVLVDIQGLHPTKEGKRLQVSWDKEIDGERQGLEKRP